jgi:hypothetical protein
MLLDGGSSRFSPRRRRSRWGITARRCADTHFWATADHESGVPDSQSASFEAQAKLVLNNFLAILDAAGAKKQDVLKVTAYIVSAENWPLFNQIFAEAFGEHRPSRSVVPVPELHHGYLIEIDGVALDTAAA